jgi:4-carboxymuconolactone decarboxylase
MTQRLTTDPPSLPRIEPVTYAEADERTKEAFDALPHVAPDYAVLGTFMRNPDLTRVHSPLMQYLKYSECLPARHRELAILRSAWMCGTDYQWAMHSQIALTAGLTQDEVDAVPSGAQSPLWAGPDRAVLTAVDELHSNCRVSEETWVALATHYDARQLLELLFLVGSYRTLAYAMNSIGIRPPGGESPNLPGNHFTFTAPEEPDRQSASAGD